MKTTSVSDFRANIKRYLDAVIRDNDSVIINRGNTGAVLISIDDYNSIRSSRDIIESDRKNESVGKGIREISEGKYTEVDIDKL